MSETKSPLIVTRRALVGSLAARGGLPPERIVAERGALTAGIYSTRSEIVEAMTAATWDGVAPLTERGPATSG